MRFYYYYYQCLFTISPNKFILNRRACNSKNNAFRFSYGTNDFREDNLQLPPYAKDSVDYPSTLPDFQKQVSLT